jgi:glycosidase
MAESDKAWLEREAGKSLNRLLPKLAERFSKEAKDQPGNWAALSSRLNSHFNDLFSLYFSLYHQEYDFFFHLEDLLYSLAKAWFARPEDLKKLDPKRERDPLWYQSNRSLGAVCYVDLFAGDLENLKEKIPYFEELGVNFIHLMPLFLVPEGNNDGGYAVSSYREVAPPLGSMELLRDFTGLLRAKGINLILDFVFNHTADDHEWARRAKSGEEEFQEYYFIFPDRKKPDAYETTLREIFPQEHRGAFTYHRGLDAWVWTTFHSYQWDLNYTNPVVFNRMVEEMLFLANIGVNVLRLDALAFIWKTLGTACENLPEAHILIRAFNRVVRIAAPSMVFLSEAIVHPDEVAKYIDPGECQLSYNPQLMALLWSTLASRETSLLRLALNERFTIDNRCAWVNYIRCHDDIGWTFSNEDARYVDINAYDHRRFLNSFYTGRFSGSFARGLPFQENPRTGDARISGTCASLAGLEKALQEETEKEVELAIKRILLIHAVILTIGGLPMIYFGDEIGTLNDYSYILDPDKAHDSRWVHRPRTDWNKMDKRFAAETLEGKVYSGLKLLIDFRKVTETFSVGNFEIAEVDNEHILGYIRSDSSNTILVLANFSDYPQVVAANTLRLYLLGYKYLDLLAGIEIDFEDREIEAYGILFLTSLNVLAS